MWLYTSLLILFKIFALILSFSSLWLLSLVVYRIWFHPLNKYPGPIFAKITDFYAAYHAWRGDLHLDMWRCHEKYGDYVRYGPQILLFNTNTAVNTVYTSGKKVQKSRGYLSMMARVANTLTQRDKTLHAQQRRVLAQGFTDSALRTCEDVIYEHSLNLCRKIQELEIQAEEWTVPQDMAKWCSYWAFDTMLDIIYDTKSEMVNKTDNRPLLDAIAISNIRVGTMIPLHRYKGSYLDFILFRSAIKARYEFIGFIRKLLDEKAREAKSPTQRKSIYDILMSSRDGEGLTPIEIAAESTNLIVAGFDTTATSISACLFYLSRYPAIYEKVTREIRTQFSSLKDFRSKSKVNTCAYLRACLTESMRMAPAIAASPFREVETGGVMVDGQALPAGCDVGTGIYAIQHNEKYYADPFLFRPERWIIGSKAKGFSSKEEFDVAQSAFMAFGKGARVCIGRPLAFQESMTFMAMLLYLFDFRVAEGDVGKLGEGVLGAEFGRHRPLEYQLYDHVTAVHEGPMLQFRKRAEIDGN